MIPSDANGGDFSPARLRVLDPSSVPDKDVLIRIHNSRHRVRFERLFKADIADYGSANEAAAELLYILALYTERNSEQMERLFRSSFLVQMYSTDFETPHQDARNNTTCIYGHIMIKKAIDRCNGLDAPMPLGEKAETPPFPLDCLPPWMRRWVEEVSVALQTPPDLAAMTALAVASAAVARKFAAAVRDGWVEPINLFAVVALPVGERKSTVLRQATEPVHRHEILVNEQLGPQLRQLRSARSVLEKRLQHLELKASKSGDPAERKALHKEIDATNEELAGLPDACECRLVCDDETPEHLAKLLAEQGGRILQASAEGTPFEIVTGRYSEKMNFDVYLKGHAGDFLRSGRIGRDGETIESPALSVALTVQPDVIAGLGGKNALAARGFLARFLYSLPASKVGRRDVAPPPLPDQSANDYACGMQALWMLDGCGHKYDPKRLKFSAEADAAVRAFEAWLEPLLADGGELSGLAGWPTKLAGHCVRLAAVLHCCDCVVGGGGASPSETEVSAGTVGRAVRLCRDYLIPHARAAMGLMGGDAQLEAARRVVKALAGWEERTITRRQIHRLTGRLFARAADMDPVLDLLVEYGYLTQSDDLLRLAGRGRKSPVYFVNPHIQDVD